MSSSANEIYDDLVDVLFLTTCRIIFSIRISSLSFISALVLTTPVSSAAQKGRADDPTVIELPTGVIRLHSANDYGLYSLLRNLHQEHVPIDFVIEVMSRAHDPAYLRNILDGLGEPGN